MAIVDYEYNEGKEGFQVSYLFESDFINKIPTTSTEALIKFTVSNDKSMDEIKSDLGAIQTQKVEVENLSGAAQGMSVAVLSIPSCMSVELSQIELLKKQGDVDNYEFSSDGSLLTLYWTYLKETETKSVSISRVMKYKGAKCQERAQRAFLYYDDNTLWV